MVPTIQYNIYVNYNPKTTYIVSTIQHNIYGAYTPNITLCCVGIVGTIFVVLDCRHHICLQSNTIVTSSKWEHILHRSCRIFIYVLTIRTLLTVQDQYHGGCCRILYCIRYLFTVTISKTSNFNALFNSLFWIRLKWSVRVTRNCKN